MCREQSKLLLISKNKNIELIFDADDYTSVMDTIDTAKEQWKELYLESDSPSYLPSLEHYITSALGNKNIDFTIMHTEVINLED